MHLEYPFCDTWPMPTKIEISPEGETSWSIVCQGGCGVTMVGKTKIAVETAWDRRN